MRESSEQGPRERIGVLGLGRMGLPIAARLATAGCVVTAFDPESERTRLAAGRGVRTAPNSAEVAAGADVLITVLPGPLELRNALLGPAGCVRTLRPGSRWLDLTSNDPRVAAEVAAEVGERGVSAVGAPMSGGPADAEGGTLGFYLAGDPDAVTHALPLLALLGDPAGVRDLGPDIRAGYTAKLLANTLWFGQVVAVTEALLLGQALGLDLATLRATLAGSAGGGVFLDQHLSALLAGDYLESFGIDRVVEELETVRDLARSARTPFELSSLVTRLHREARERFGPVGGELLAAKLLEERAGATLRTEG